MAAMVAVAQRAQHLSKKSDSHTANASSAAARRCCLARSHHHYLLLLLLLAATTTLIQLTQATSRVSGHTDTYLPGRPPTTTATTYDEGQQLWSHQEPEVEPTLGDTLGVKVNRSLAQLDSGPEINARNDLSSGSSSSSSSSSSSQMRRLLVRELTSLIMNNEPEIIAENVRGARVSGQMVSESGLFDVNEQLSNATSESSPLVDAGHAAFKEEPLSLPINSGSNGDFETTIGDTAQQVAQQTLNSQQPVDNLDNSAQSINLNSNSNNNNNNNNQDDQYVTCSPDYEDQTMIEAAGNLTAEQQQQLLASADSSGILNQSSSADPANNSLAPVRPPGQCVHPGSRMIEMITKVITPILFSIIIVVGLVGNIVVMLVIIEDRKTERELTPTNLLILDLSLADLSFIIFCIPFTGWDYSVGHWVFGLLWCKFNQYLIVVCALSSIYTLVLMSVDRFMAIVYPIECISYRTSKNTLYAIYIKWILILLMASPTIPMHGLIDLPMGPDTTILYTCRFLSDQFNPLQFQIIFFITSYLFPLILIFCLYLSLLNKLWFGSKPHGHKESQKMLDSKKRVTMLVASIVVVFALCWCPIQIMLILMRLKSHKITVTYVAIQVFAHILGYMNSCVNPIVYAFASETFHNSFKRSSIGRVFCCLFCCSNGAHQDNDRPIVTLTGRNSAQHNNQPNTSLLNHLDAHHHHHPPNQHHHHQPDCDLIQTNGNNTNSNRHNSLNVNCHDSTVSTTTLIMTSYNTAANDNISKIVTLPLEPRDRDLPPPPPFGATIEHLSPSRKTEANTCTQDSSSTQTQLSSANDEDQNEPFAKKPQQQTTAKQQLVVHVVQDSNQISHQCKPCYQQDLIAP